MSKQNEILLWHVRIINEKGEFYPHHKGFLVRQEVTSELDSNGADQAFNACCEVAKFFDNEEDGEFEGWELTADIVEFYLGNGLVAEL